MFQTEKVEEDEEEAAEDEDDGEKDEDEDAKVEEEDEDKKSKKTVDKTVWDWALINENKPLWTKKWVPLHLYIWSCTFIHSFICFWQAPLRVWR